MHHPWYATHCRLPVVYYPWYAHDAMATWPHLTPAPLEVTEVASSAAFFDPSDKSARRAIGEVIRAQRGVRSSGAQQHSALGWSAMECHW
jgi:hypothetical protein